MISDRLIYVYGETFYMHNVDGDISFRPKVLNRMAYQFCADNPDMCHRKKETERHERRQQKMHNKKLGK